jgi:eukaryotic-like serine/threonine-protein kinase
MLFALELEKPVDLRPAFLDALCAGDPGLRQRLEGLLAAHDQPETLLSTQAKAARPTIKLDLADAPDEAVGQMLGRYKLLERVGDGGCRVVYVAEQNEPVRRRVALKLIKLGMDTKQVVARFEAEVSHDDMDSFFLKKIRRSPPAQRSQPKCRWQQSCA